LKSNSIGELIGDFDVTNNKLLSMNKAISILRQEKQDYSQQSFEQQQELRILLSHFLLRLMGGSGH